VLSLLDAAIVAAFLGYCVASGLRARAASSRNLEQYFLAGRTLPGWKAGISMAATQFAADTPLLVTGMIAVAGVFSLWRLWIYALAFLLLGFLLAGPWRRARVLTDAELAELRYGGRLATVLRAAKALYFGTLFNCSVLAMVLFASATISEPFLHWDEWLPERLFGALVDFVRWAGLSLVAVPGSELWAERSASNLLSILVVVSVTALYSTTGGLRAVVATDVVQFAIAMLASLLYAVVVVRLVGGLEALAPRLAELYGGEWARATLDFTPAHAREAGWVVLGTIAIQWIAQMNADGTGYLAQRAMACRSDRDARQAALVFVGAQVFLRSLAWIPIGLALLVLVPMEPERADAAFTAARERTFVEGIALYLPSGLRGLMLTGLLAALASTLDSHLNWGASYWTNDLYGHLVCRTWRGREPSGRELVWVARASNLWILALAIAILSRLTSIESAWKASLLLGAGMGGPLLLRWLWWRVTAAAELCAIVASSALAPVLLWGVEDEGARMLVIALASTGVAVCASLLSPP
jgi:Na+/proline symporter